MIARPLWVCLRYLLHGLRRRPATVLYPFEKIRLPYQWRGLHRLDDDRCTGCGTCARSCPNLCIELIQVAPKKKRPSIDIGRCLFCGYCVDVCPFGALHMTGNYELAVFSRAELIMTPEKLSAVRDVREGTLDEELWRRVYKGEEIPPWPPLPERPVKGTRREEARASEARGGGGADGAQGERKRDGASPAGVEGSGGGAGAGGEGSASEGSAGSGGRE
ncbi:MAG: NuoI/complex I 23 kDa subunit family protein [Thermoplasmatota archaeon]